MKTEGRYITGSLNGKTAFVTGGSSGIGRTIALQLGERGVAMHYGTAKGNAAAVVENIRAVGGEAFIVDAELSDVQCLPGCLSGWMPNSPPAAWAGSTF